MKKSTMKTTRYIERECLYMLVMMNMEEISGMTRGIEMGNMTCVSGDVHEGAWKDHKRHGKGQMVYFDCDHYEGDWKVI